MAQPVWLLSVDLQTKTATFQSGLSDAAKAARGAFGDIKQGAGEMGRDTSFSMMEARHSVMILGEEFGIRLPRALAGFIASLGPIGPALEAAFPFMALIGLAALFIEHLHKMREAGMKFTEDQAALALAIQKAFDTLDDKILEAQIKTDEYNKDHLGALKKTLELIDHQSMEELATQFDELAKRALDAFKEIQSHWYSFGIGSDGAKNALQEFQTEYDALLAKNTKQGDEEASGLLRGTLGQAQKTLDMMKQLSASRAGDGQKGDYAKYEEAAEYLQKMGLLSKVTNDYTKDELNSQKSLVNLLQNTVSLEERINTLKGMRKNEATAHANAEVNQDAEAAARKEAEALKRGHEEMARLIAEQYRQQVADTQEGEREQIAATREGSAERLAAITAAIQHEESLGLQETGWYRGLLVERVNLVRQMAEEESREKEKEQLRAAQMELQGGLLALDAYKRSLALAASTRNESLARRVSDETRVADMEYNLKVAALDKELAALDKYGKDYESKLKQIQDREKQLTQQHENDITAIKQRAETQRNQTILASLNQFESSVARGLTQSIMGHQTWAQMITSLGDQVVSNMIQNALLVAMQQDKDRLGDAKTAAANTYSTVSGWPVVGPFIAPVLAAGAFAAVMAFQGGTDMVPGTGRGDVVPAMLTPGEGVVPGGVMDGLRTMARNGGFENQRPQHHVVMHNSFHVNTIDGDGMQGALEKHSDQLQRHFEKSLRRMNR